MTDGVLGVWGIHLMTGARRLVAVVRKQLVCQCGCRGWCTYWMLLWCLRWSFDALAEGFFPRTRHDGSDWKASDEARRTKAGARMKRKCVVIQFRGDWPEICERVGPPTWNSLLRPCFCCRGFGADLYDTAQVGVGHVPWQVNTDEDFEAATRRCEIWVVVLPADHVLLCRVLAFDKRDSGSAGLALTQDYAPLGLRQDDRLEPCPELSNVELFFTRADFPRRVLFWRPCRNTLTTHRSPLINPRIGITPTSVLCIDLLHTLFLGPMQRWAHKVSWLLLSAGIWGGVETAAEERHRVSVLGLRAAIRTFYREERQARRRFTQTPNLNIKMFGASWMFKFRFKAMETFTMVKFFVWLLPKYPGRVGPDHADALESGQCLVDYVALLRSQPVNMSAEAHRDMVNIWGRFAALVKPWHIETPKMHLMCEMHHRAPFFGNPWTYHTFLDEGLNKVLKRVSRLCHQQNFEWLAMHKASGALRRRNELMRDEYG